MNDGGLRDEINKRLTLNWLIQGAAQHAGMTFHHLVRDELDALDPHRASPSRRLAQEGADCRRQSPRTGEKKF